MVQSLGQDFTSESVNVIKSVRSALAVAKHRRSDLEVEKTGFDMEKEQSKSLTASQEEKSAYRSENTLTQPRGKHCAG
jgi:hypothetical protein